MDSDRLRELIDWSALGLPAEPFAPATPLEERDLEHLQAARGHLMATPARPKDAIAVLKPLLDEGKYDIRALAVLLQAVAYDRPVLGAAAALDQLARLIGKQWEELGPAPEDKRRRLAG